MKKSLYIIVLLFDHDQRRSSCINHSQSGEHEKIVRKDPGHTQTKQENHLAFVWSPQPSLCFPGHQKQQDRSDEKSQESHGKWPGIFDDDPARDVHSTPKHGRQEQFEINECQATPTRLRAIVISLKS